MCSGSYFLNTVQSLEWGVGIQAWRVLFQASKKTHCVILGKSLAFSASVFLIRKEEIVVLSTFIKQLEIYGYKVIYVSTITDFLFSVFSYILLLAKCF